LSSFDGSQFVKAGREALARNRGVFIFGPCGTGKSHLATGLLLEWFANKERVSAECEDTPRPKAQFVSTIDLLIELKESFNSRDGDARLLRKYSEYDLLVLDDLGAERATDWSRQVINVLVDRRYREMKPMIFTSNLGLNALSDAFDDRMASRIAGACEVLQLAGSDRRIRIVASEPEQQSLAVVK
jgi:DNA replication protein DnaC